MVRADRQMPDVYFGRPGALIQLPWPRGGIDRSYDRQTYDFATGSGMHAVSSLSTGSIPYSMAWNALHVDNFSKLNQYRVGANGPGPWVFIDPTAPNLLPANVAGATGLYNSNLQFESTGGVAGTAGSNANTTYIHRAQGYRSIRWQFLVTPSTFPSLGVAPRYRNWPGHPVVPNLPYTFSSWMRADGVVDTSITVKMALQWKDVAGATITEPSSGDIAVSTWQRLSITATAPSNAAYVRPLWVATGSSITVNGALYIDEPLLEQDTVVNDWAPGTGISPVEIVSLAETVPAMGASRFRQGIQLALREVAR